MNISARGKTMLAMIKLGMGLFKTYKYAIIAVALVGVLSTVYVHIRNDGIRDTQIAAYELSDAVKSRKIGTMNARFIEQNKEKLAALAESKKKIKAAQAAAKDIEAQNAEMELDIGVLRFEILEAMQNDEEYTDWAYGVVLSDTWLMLGAANSAATD